MKDGGLKNLEVKGRGMKDHEVVPRGAFDLGPAVWILVFLLFILERVVSFSTLPAKWNDFYD
jgi:hypothetical protein